MSCGKRVVKTRTSLIEAIMADFFVAISGIVSSISRTIGLVHMCVRNLELAVIRWPEWLLSERIFELNLTVLFFVFPPYQYVRIHYTRFFSRRRRRRFLSVVISKFLCRCATSCLNVCLCRHVYVNTPTLRGSIAPDQS